MMRLDSGHDLSLQFIVRLKLTSSTINEDFGYDHTWLNMKKIIHSHP